MNLSGREMKKLTNLTEKASAITARILNNAKTLMSHGDNEGAKEQFRRFGMIKPSEIEKQVPQEFQETSLPPKKVYPLYLDEELIRAKQGMMLMQRLLLQHGAKPH